MGDSLAPTCDCFECRWLREQTVKVKVVEQASTFATEKVVLVSQERDAALAEVERLNKDVRRLRTLLDEAGFEHT